MKSILAFLCLLPWLTLAQVPTIPGGAVPWFRLKSSSTIDLPQGITYWWSGKDLSAGSVSSWTDRSNSVVFFSGDPRMPTADGTNVYFNGDQIMTNVNMKWAVNGAEHGQVTQIVSFVIKMPAITSTRTLLRTTNGTETIFYVSSTAGFKGLRYSAAPASYTEGGNPFTTNEIVDVVWIHEINDHLCIPRGYTNGVFIGNSTSTLGQPTDGGYFMGNYNTLASDFNGYVYDIIVWTNLAANINTVSNIHRWRTNFYGGTL